jgi:hypothetical protein
MPLRACMQNLFLGPAAKVYPVFQLMDRKFPVGPTPEIITG